MDDHKAIAALQEISRLLGIMIAEQWKAHVFLERIALAAETTASSKK
jgi:hypothetical protein